MKNRLGLWSPESDVQVEPGMLICCFGSFRNFLAHRVVSYELHWYLGKHPEPATHKNVLVTTVSFN